MNLSLASVAADRYSTSLISQIERNRVDPSDESLQYLAEQLHLPLADLQILAQRQREAEDSEYQATEYELLHAEVMKKLDNRESHEALQKLNYLNFSQTPAAMRWRLAALRGQCHFRLRQFFAAQRDFSYALIEKPAIVPSAQCQEAVELQLHFAAALRELGQTKAAFEQFKKALELMDSKTPLWYIAEAHWGMSLIAFSLANRYAPEQHAQKMQKLQKARSHADYAYTLYSAVNDKVRVSLMGCQTALIEQSLGQADDARKHLGEILQVWLPEFERLKSLKSSEEHSDPKLSEVANIVAAAACSLAGVELEAGSIEQASEYAQQASDAGGLSNKLRQAEAALMRGRILEKRNMQSEAATAFQEAIEVLAGTDRLAARIRAHDLLGRHLLKQGEVARGEQELDMARNLSSLALVSSSATIVFDAEDADATDSLQ
jgi:tetratricopeptide (TPR) repeat protein